MGNQGFLKTDHGLLCTPELEYCFFKLVSSSFQRESIKYMNSGRISCLWFLKQIFEFPAILPWLPMMQLWTWTPLLKKIRLKNTLVFESLPNFFENTHCPKYSFSREYTATTPSSGNPWALGTNVARSFPSLEMSQLASLWILQLGTITLDSPKSNSALAWTVRKNRQLSECHVGYLSAITSQSHVVFKLTFLNMVAGDNNAEQATSLFSCYGVFTDHFLFRTILARIRITQYNIKSHKPVSQSYKPKTCIFNPLMTFSFPFWYLISLMH